MKRKALSLVLFITLCFVGSASMAEDKFEPNDLRNLIKTEMRNWNVPAVAVLIVKNDKVIFSEGFGYRNVEKKLKVTSNTIFGIGSVSKSFTVLALGMLADEKKLDFDQPVRNYLPTFRMYDDYLTGHITPRDMLSHRSGLPRHDLVWYNAGLTAEETTKRIKYLQLSYGFRERFQYNNLMYQASGCLVRKLTGETWEEFVKKRIFMPLGMKSSNFSIEELQKYPDYALPYSMNINSVKKFPEKLSDIDIKRIPFFKMTANGPAGSINSNLTDMAKCVRFHLAEGKVDGKQIIARETLLQMHAPQMVIPLDSVFKFLIYDETPTISYGLGWFIQPYRGHYMVNHGGNVPGFTSLVSFIPKEKIGVVVLTNMNGTSLTYVMTFNIFDRLLGLKPIDWGKRLMTGERENWEKKKEAEAEAEKQHRKNTRPSHPLVDYAGHYRHPAYGEIIIGKEGKRLNIKFRDRTVPIEHYHYDTFRISDEDPDHLLVYFDARNVTFLLNKNGDIDRLALPLQTGVDDIVFQKVARK
ncbi:penicillin-binding protein [Candidatus Aerophobetes bacterium Ae_b3b]|nr:MAG: penicillin-binding protein [Candidatus Aerophobetes bacterium Ae_b3b]